MTVLKVQNPNVFWKCLDKTLLTSMYKSKLNHKTKEQEFGHKHKHIIMNINQAIFKPKTKLFSNHHTYMREKNHIIRKNKMTMLIY